MAKSKSMKCGFIHSYGQGYSATPVSDTLLLSIIYGAAKARALGYSPIVLSVDDSAHLWFRDKGLLPLYDAVRIFEPRADVEPSVFWSISKILGAIRVLEDTDVFSSRTDKVVTCDLDAAIQVPPDVLFSGHDVVAFNEERRTWRPYSVMLNDPVVTLTVDKAICGDFPNFAVSGWEGQPINVGVFGASGGDMIRMYVLIRNCMVALTRKLHEGSYSSKMFNVCDSATGVVSQSTIAEVMYTEQLLPAFFIHRMRASLRFMAQLCPTQRHSAFTHEGYHLHSSKEFYANNPSAKHSFITWITNEIHALGKSGLFLTAGLPYLRVKDPNSGAYRWVYGSADIGPGDTDFSIY